MDSKSVAIGFFLFFAANAIVGLFLAPIAAQIGGFFGFLGMYAVWLGSSIITFPVLVGVFWFARKGHVDGEIPETG